MCFGFTLSGSYVFLSLTLLTDQNEKKLLVKPYAILTLKQTERMIADHVDSTG